MHYKFAGIPLERLYKFKFSGTRIKVLQGQEFLFILFSNILFQVSGIIPGTVSACSVIKDLKNKLSIRPSFSSYLAYTGHHQSLKFS